MKWITTTIATGSFIEVEKTALDKDICIIDVRDLVDKSGNDIFAIKKKIEESFLCLQHKKKIIICCDHGISRSNAIACGVIAITESISFVDATRRVIEKTGEAQIKPDVLSKVYKAIAGKKKRENDYHSILLTGATGDIGSLLFNALKTEFNVYTIPKSEIDLSKNLTLLDVYIKENNISSIIHLAHPRVANTNSAMGEAISMVKNILDVCVENNCRITFLSTMEVFSGHQVRKLKILDQTKFLPKNIFGETKFLSEELIRLSAKKHKINYSIIRLTSVYGEGCLKPKFLLNFIHKAKKSQQINTHKYITGFPIVDLIHVEDVVKLIVAIHKKNYKGELNVCGGTPLSTVQIAEMIKKVSFSNSKISSIPIHDKNCRLIFNNTAAYKKIKWKPEIKFQDAITKLINLYNHEN